MIRIVKQSGKYYGLTIDSIEEDQDNIETFVKDGVPVIIVDSLKEIDKMDLIIGSSEIEMID